MPYAPPFSTLEYLYFGTSDFERDLVYYRDTLGAPLVWNFNAFEARVAAFKVCQEGGPLLLIADHRKAPSCLPVFAVEDLDKTQAELEEHGWKHKGERFGIPDGPCLLFEDESGNELAVFGNERPHVLEQAYNDPDNRRAVH